MKQLVIVLICLAAFSNCYSQNMLERPKEKLWNISSCMGTAFFTSELLRNFKNFKNEFEHKPGYTWNVSVTRILRNRIEPGISLEFTTFKGFSNNPDFTANGIHTSFIDPIITQPVRYGTRLVVPSIYIRYNFKDVLFPKRRKYYINYFVEGRVGAAILVTKLNYTNTSDHAIIFEKGRGSQPIPGLNAQYTLATGFRFDYDPNWGLLFLIDINMDNYDCLDAVHNYASDGSRLHSIGLYSRIMMGFSYTLNTKERQISSSSYKKWRYRSDNPKHRDPWSGVKK